MSRSTFRDACADVAWQKQLRDRFAAEGTPPVPHLDVRHAEVRAVGRRLAEQVILKYEWLGTMASTSRHYGIFFGSYCAGVCCVEIGAVGANPYASRQFGLTRQQLAYLARGACVHWAPTGTNSKLVAWTCRLLAKQTSAKLIIAYSDTDAGEIGTIYQACNWTYIGRGSSTRQWVAPGGRIYDQKLASDLKRKHGGTRQDHVRQLRAAGWVEQSSNPKHRYVYVLDRTDAALARRIEHLRQPYPKRSRATAVDSDGAGDQPEQGGAIPTVAL